MQHLFQSGFLLALGKAITSSFWQMALLFVVYELLVFFCSVKQAWIKNFISSAFSLIGFVWFVATLFFFCTKTSTATLVIESGFNNAALFKIFSHTNNWQLLLSWMEYKLNYILPYLSIAYLFVLLWFSTKLIFQLKATNDLRAKGIVAVEDELQTYFSFLTFTLGITKKVELYISNCIDIPATFGCIKPIILLPAAAVLHLTPQQLEAVLLHELAHIKRNDYFWNLLLAISETILFFNPFAQILIAIARKEREISCDDVVMSYQQNAVVYAEALLNVEMARQQLPRFVLALGDNKQHLKLRVKRILNLPIEKNKISTRFLALVFFTFVFGLMGWMLQQKKITKELNSNPNQLMLKNEEVFFTNPDAIISKEGKNIGFSKVKLNVKLHITKEPLHHKYIVWNEAGESAIFDNLIVTDFPQEWVHEFIPSEKLTTPALPIMKQGKVPFQFHTDSGLQQQQLQKLKEIALKQLYISQFNRYKLNTTSNYNKDAIWPNTSYYDSLFAKSYGLQNFEMYTWKEQAPFLEMHESMSSDKIKQLKKKLQSSPRLLELRNHKQWPSRTVPDSIKKHFRAEQNEKAKWSFTFDKMVTEEQMEHHQNFVFVIGNKQIFINGIDANKFTDSSDVAPVQKQLQKRIRVLEVIKL